MLSSYGWRWLVVALLGAALLFLGEQALQAQQRGPEAGLRLEQTAAGEWRVASVEWGGLAASVGIRPGDAVLAFDAPPPEGSWLRTRGADGEERTLSRGEYAPSPYHLIALPLIALSFMLAGGGAFLFTRQLTVAATSLLLGACGAAALLAWLALPARQPWAAALSAAAMVGAGGALLLLFLVFPVDRLTTRRRRGHWLLRLLAARPSFLPLALLVLVPWRLRGAPLLEAQLSALSLLAMPLGLAFALLSSRFESVELLVRRGFAPLASWMVVGTLALMLYAALLAAGASGLLAVAVLTIVIPLVWAYTMQAVEFVLFQDSYDYAPTLRELAVEVGTLSGLESIARHVLRRLSEVLQLGWAELELEQQEGRPLLFEHGKRPEGAAPARALTLTAEGRPFGQLRLGQKQRGLEPSAADATLLETLMPLLTTALHNALLLNQRERQVRLLEGRERELAELAGRLMSAQEDERRRIALELHDEPLQALILLARRYREAGGAGCLDTEQLAAELRELADALRAVCAELMPPGLDNLGVQAGLERLVSNLRAESTMSVQLHCQADASSGAGRPAAAAETALCRVAQEALTNCLRHSGARHVAVTLRRQQGELLLEVRDDGCGFDLAERRRQASRHLGLLGMSERLRPWGGRVEVTSQPGQGTLVRAALPLAGEERGDV